MSCVRRGVGAARAAGRLVLLLAVLTTAAVVPATAAGAVEASASATGTPALPFDMPSTSSLRASSRKAFAHYVPTIPLSLDNQDPASDYYSRNYLRPEGESGKHAAYGGFLRDRPMPRAPRPEASWRLLDMESEVRSAIAAGLDGFILVLYNVPDAGETRLWQNAVLLMQAAHNVDPGFEIVLQPDLSSGTSLRTKSPQTLAKYMAQLASYSSAYRLPDGRVVISPFTAEGQTTSWWSTFLSTMKNTHGKPVAFLPLFQDEKQWRSAFDPISWGMSNWGNRNPLWNDPDVTYSTGSLGRVAAVHALGQKWMQPISTQDARPRSGVFDEAENTTNLRNTWEIAIKSGAELVQYATWGDYPEGSVMAPTPKHGRSFLDISAYYLTQWKTGRAPSIVRDTVYLTHRTHKVAAKPTYPQTKLMSLRGGSPARDTVEALTFLTAPATVVVQVGSRTHSCQVDAGVDTCTVPLESGKVSAKVTRSGTTVTAVSSKHSVTSAPYVQDLEYVAASSRREGSSATSPTAPVPEAPAPTGTVVALTPTADTYGNALDVTRNYGASSSLTARADAAATSYLRFALPAAPAGTTLVKAVLRTRTGSQTFAGSSDTQLVQKASDSWSESTLTWGNRPALGTVVLGRIAPVAGPNTASLTALDAAGLRTDLGRQITLAVVGGGADSTWFWSSEHATSSYRPQLELTFG